jgi:benzoate membrane transport protein
MPVERPAAPPPSAREVLADLGGVHAINALVAFIFAASGPVAIILAVGTRGGLTPQDYVLYRASR